MDNDQRSVDSQTEPGSRKDSDEEPFVALGRATELTRRASGDKTDGSETSGNDMYHTN